MIELIIFHLHLMAALYAFSYRWRTTSVREALLGPVVVGLVFAIGWSLTSALSYLITPDGGFASWLTADTVSLLLLLIPEIVVFRMLFWGRERQPARPLPTAE